MTKGKIVNIFKWIKSKITSDTPKVALTQRERILALGELMANDLSKAGLGDVTANER